MPGPIKAHNRRFSVILHRAQRAWLDAEAERIDRGLTAADVLRGALAHFQAQPERVRELVVIAVAAAPDEEAGSGQDQRV
jgi:hypothetical protein